MLQTMWTEFCGAVAILTVLASIMWLLNRSNTFWRICDRITQDGASDDYTVRQPHMSPVEHYYNNQRRRQADQLRNGGDK
jgi:hypothetical protein